MTGSVTVVIPTLNEEARIGDAIDSAFAAGAAEVIVSDGGSADATVSVAESRGARVLTGETTRGRQLNRGAAEASGDFVIFLHADTTLPTGACAAVATSGARFGGFRLRFAEKSLRLRFAAALINLRTRLARCPWGDQAQFVTRSEFLADGGFREMPIMEDYELAVRMKRRGRVVLLPLKVTTSGRRFLDRGLLRTTFTNWRIVFAYRRGTDVNRLAQIYRRR